MPQIRQTEIHARRVRRAKLHKLRERYAGSKSPSEKEKVLLKVARLAPWMAGDAFLETVKGGK